MRNLLLLIAITSLFMVVPTYAQPKVLNPYMLKQVGATNDQPLCWSTANDRWEPGNCGGGTPLTDTDDLTEGATNLYFTNARARAAISGGNNVTYTSGTGVIDVDSFPFSSLTGTASDAQIPDTITVSNYLPLVGGTLTGSLVTDNLGIEFAESDTNPGCAAGEFKIYADLSENTLKKCDNGVVSDLDTTTGAPSFDTITGGTNTSAAMIIGTGGSLTVSGSGTINATTLSSTALADFILETELDAEAELETQLADVTDVFTNNDQIGAANLGTDSVSADELNATGVEAELEAVLDLQELQGAVTDGQVPDTITVSNYLLLAGGTLTGQLISDNLGIEFTESDTNPTCAAGNFSIYADLSENTLKKCNNGTVSDLDTTGGGGSSINLEENNVEVISAANLTGIDFLGADFDVTDSSFEADVAIAAAITRDTEWDSIAELESATSANILTSDEGVQMASAVTTDNSLLKTVGTSGRNAEETGVTIDDSNNMTLPGTLTVGSTSSTILTAEGATADAFETVLALVDPTADRTITLPNATGTVTLLEDFDTFAELDALVADKALTNLADNFTVAGDWTLTGAWDASAATVQIPGSITLPGSCSGTEIYLDTNATSGQQLYACESGTFVLQGDGNSGGGSGDPVGANENQSFTSQTSVVLTHNFGHNKLIVNCYNGSEAAIEPATITIGSGPAYDTTVTFSSAQTGRCVVSGGGAAIYTATITAQTSFAVTAATHGLGTNAYVGACHDNSATPEQVWPDTAPRNGSGDITLNFGSSFTGTCEIRQ